MRKWRQEIKCCEYFQHQPIELTSYSHTEASIGFDDNLIYWIPSSQSNRTSVYYTKYERHIDSHEQHIQWHWIFNIDWQSEFSLISECKVDFFGAKNALERIGKKAAGIKRISKHIALSSLCIVHPYFGTCFAISVFLASLSYHEHSPTFSPPFYPTRFSPLWLPCNPVRIPFSIVHFFVFVLHSTEA